MKKSKSKSVNEGLSSGLNDYGFAVNLMQFLVVPAFVLDAQGKVLIWNKACERLTGLDAADVLGTADHWMGFYESPRPCLADLVAQSRPEDMGSLYFAHEESDGVGLGLHAENWCVMPRLGTQRYLYIDAGPIYDTMGGLLAVVETLRDMTVQKKAQIELESLAVRDGLTGVINRRGFDDALKIAWSSSQRNGLPISLLMIDVDHFKRFNDTYGHQAGDECLKAVANALKDSVMRPADVLARYGGEEFAVILPSIDVKGAAEVACRIVDTVHAKMIPHSGGEAGRVSVSVGVAVVVPSRDATPERLIGLADKALYRAKDEGRNRMVMDVIQ